MKFLVCLLALAAAVPAYAYHRNYSLLHPSFELPGEGAPVEVGIADSEVPDPDLQSQPEVDTALPESRYRYTALAFFHGATEEPGSPDVTLGGNSIGRSGDPVNGTDRLIFGLDFQIEVDRKWYLSLAAGFLNESVEQRPQGQGQINVEINGGLTMVLGCGYRFSWESNDRLNYGVSASVAYGTGSGEAEVNDGARSVTLDTADSDFYSFQAEIGGTYAIYISDDQRSRMEVLAGAGLFYSEHNLEVGNFLAGDELKLEYNSREPAYLRIGLNLTFLSGERPWSIGMEGTMGGRNAFMMYASVRF